jgi:serine/threonine protein kinase
MFHMPSHIDRYEIKTLIAAGGMGSLYLARDTNPNTNRLVAVKLLLANLDSGDLRERFAREARALAALNHPNIVDIYDSGEFQGSPFIVMEYVRGETLAEKIKRRAPMSLAQQLKLMVELCSGLAHAHEAGIIHRDIKPANLMVDQYGRLKILDFGIARVSEGLTRYGGVQVTQLNMRIGTPGYMSPEQIEGGDIDRRSDIFAVGAVCYELVSFHEAFTGTNTRQVENKVLQSQPERLTTLIPDLDPEIEQIINRALAKDPKDRFQDATSLEEAFERMRWRVGPGQTPEPTLVRNTPDPTPSPSRKSRDSRADVAYQKSLALYSEGAHDAARRCAIEALAEDPEHEEARTFVVQRFGNRAWVPAAHTHADPYAGSEATVLRTGSHPMGTMTANAETVLSTGSYRSGSSARQRTGQQQAGVGKGLLIAAIVAAVVVVVGAAVYVAFTTMGSGQMLTITKPEGGTLSSPGITCGTNGSSCTKKLAKGAVVQLRADPDDGYTFKSFTGACAPNGLTTIDGPQTCGAIFAKVEAVKPVPTFTLTVVKATGGTIIGPGIQCGTMGDECQAEVEQGKAIKLTGLADPDFTAKGFTGECARSGDAIMNQARRCSALFMKDRVTAGGGGGTPGGTRGGLPGAGTGIATGAGAGGAVGGGTTGPSGGGGGRATDPLEGRGGTHGTSEPEPKPDGKPDGPAPTADAIAKEDIKNLLEAFRKAYEARDVPGIKRLYPTASEAYLKGLQNAFNYYKSLEYTYTTPLEYLDLSPPVGTATVKVGALSKPEYKGPKDPPQKLNNLFTLKRTDGNWTIQALTVTPVK